MPQARNDPTFWSSCCEAIVDYIGYYQCSQCKQFLHMGRNREPHLLSVKPGTEAARPAGPRTVQPFLFDEAATGA